MLDKIRKYSRYVKRLVTLCLITTIVGGYVLQVTAQESLEVSEEQYITQTLLVETQSELVASGEESMMIEVGSGFYILLYESVEDTQKAYAILSEDSNVISVEVDQPDSLEATAILEDDIEEEENAYEIIQGYDGFLETFDIEESRSVTIALVDTQVDIVDSRVWESVSVLEEVNNEDSGAEDYAEHGNQLTELLLAYTTNNVEIMPITAFDNQGQGSVLSAYLGIQAGIDAQVDIINLSFAGEGVSPILELAIKEAREAGILVVTAAGNQGEDVENYMPANIEAVITVGSINDKDELMSYSNRGSTMDLVAYDTYVYEGNSISGTSISAAYVTAALSLMIGTMKEGSMGEIEEKILSQAIDLGEDGWDEMYGYGKVSLCVESEEMEEDEVIEDEREEDEVIEDEAEEDEVIDDEVEDDEVIDDEVIEGEVWMGNEDVTQVLSTSSVPVTAYTFYNSTSWGNYGYNVVEYDGGIYWCSRGKVASSSSTTKYDNIGWYVQIRNTAGQEVVVYIDELNYRIEHTQVGDYYYNLFQISKTALSTFVTNAGYNATSFFAGTITVEFDGNIGIYTNGTLVAGPYNLMYSSQYTTLIDKMENVYYFTSSSVTTVKENYRNKSISFAGSNVITYTYTFNANGGSVSPTSITFVAGSNITYPTPTRTGYTFTGWMSTTTGIVYGAGVISTSTANGNRTFLAQWTLNSCTVSYNANGGTGAPAAQTKYYGSILTLDSTIPTRSGYTFTGWNTASNGTGQSYSAGGLFGADVGATLYAQWKQNTYTVTFNGNGSTSGSMSSLSYGINSWYTLPNNSFVKQHTVTYNADGGVATKSSEVVASTFAGWIPSYTMVNGTTSYSSSKFNAAFYANLYSDLMNAYGYNATGLLSHYVTFIVNGSETRIAVNSGSYSSSYNVYPSNASVCNLTYTGGTATLLATWNYGVITLLTATKEGYTFDYWLCSNGAKIAAGGLATIGGDLTFTAIWDELPTLEVGDVYMYLNEDIDEYRFYKEAVAIDAEDGDISDSILFNKDELEIELEALREIELTEDVEYETSIMYTVTDSNGGEVTVYATLHIYGIYDGELENTSDGFVRFISEEYLDTLEEESVWREEDMMAYLVETLNY